VTTVRHRGAALPLRRIVERRRRQLSRAALAGRREGQRYSQSMFSLDQLRCFVAVAEEANFRKAAIALQMTQAPVSRQVQKLEHSVGSVS
jgi:hypothetical protein